MASTQRKVLVIVVRADPIVCGHSTEARNLAEAALKRGYEPIILTWDQELLRGSGLPLKPIDQVSPYSPGILVHRPKPVGNYKILDGRYMLGMTSFIVDLVRSDPSMQLTLMCLYLQPHAKIVLDAVRAIRATWEGVDVRTVAEAVGSDITNVLSNAMVDRNYGAAITVITDFLSFDVPVCVSEFTLDEILRHSADLDAAIGTDFTPQIRAKVGISYPALDCLQYTSISPESCAKVLAARGLEARRYVLYLSRVIEAKGVFELVRAFQDSSCLRDRGYQLVMVGSGEALEDLRKITDGDQSIMHITDLRDEEKAAVFNGAASYVLPSKFHPTFVETFGIVIVEAMLAGSGPVVVCPTGGIPEAAGESCIYADAGSVLSLQAALEKAVLMPADEAASMTAKACQHALQFDRENIFRLLEEKINATRSPAVAVTDSPPSHGLADNKALLGAKPVLAKARSGQALIIRMETLGPGMNT